jgi:hypothetical protein
MPNRSPRKAGSRRRLYAADLFTDRFSESRAFREALSAQRTYIDNEHYDDAARNILTFYGLGGIGKTTLSERLEDWVNGKLRETDVWGEPPATAVAATTRIDLQRSRGRFDLLEAVIAIRRMHGAVRKSWPAFDLIFTAYWSSIRPGEPLPGSGTSNSAFADTATETVAEILNDLGIPGTGIATRSIRFIAKKGYRWRLRRYAEERFTDFEDLLERCTDIPTPDNPDYGLLIDTLAFLSHDDWDDAGEPLFVVFIDGFEKLTSDPRRADERSLNEMIYSLSNVMFVVTGRNSIDWYDSARTDLYAAGPKVWPNLIPGGTVEPRQHRVGKLNMADRLRIISRGSQLYDIEIDDNTAKELALYSNGLPQYLDLALEVALTKKRNGADAVNVADVTGSLDHLVMRVLEDIPEDEQRAIRAACLFSYFDSSLLAGAAEVDHGCALRAIDRPMIDNRGSAVFPYTMHDEIRHAIRSASHKTPNGWSERDWLLAAERGLDSVRKRFDDAVSAEESGTSLEVLGLAISLVCNQEIKVGPATSTAYEDWLSQAIVYAPSIVGLRGKIPTHSNTFVGQGILDFVLAKTYELPIDDRVELLTGVFESKHPLRRPAGRHRGYVLRDASRWDDAIAAFNELIEVAPTMVHLYQRVLTFVTARRFRQAIDQSHLLTDDRAERIHAACEIMHGSFDEWFDIAESRLSVLRAGKRRREEIEKVGADYRWRSLLVGDVDYDALVAFEAEADEAVHMGGLWDALVAKVFLRPHEYSMESDAIRWLDTIERSRNAGEIGFRFAWVSVALGMFNRDTETLQRLASEVDAREAGRGRNWIPVECVLNELGYQVSVPPAQWLRPYPDVSARWKAIFDEWRERSSQVR